MDGFCRASHIYYINTVVCIYLKAGARPKSMLADFEKIVINCCNDVSVIVIIKH